MSNPAPDTETSTTHEATEAPEAPKATVALHLHVVESARHLHRNLVRAFGRRLDGHDLATCHAASELAAALEAWDAHVCNDTKTG